MNKHDWQNAFGPAPDDFLARVDETLHRLEERDMRRRTKFATALIAAALITALLAGAAVAVSRLDIWESLNYASPLVPLESADALVATDLAVGETDGFRVYVQEGVYDGYGVIVKLRFEPKDPEKSVLLAGFTLPGDVSDGYITDVIETYEGGIKDERIVGRKDGKAIIWLSTPQLAVDVESENAENHDLEDLLNTYREQYNEDGSVEYWISGLFANDLPETLNVKLSVRGMDAEGNAVYGRIDALPFQLVKSNRERTVRLAPADESRIDGFELVDVKIVFTEIRGYISAEYVFENDAPDEDVDLWLLDAEGNRLSTGSGCCRKLDNGHFLWEMEMQTYESVPETMIVEPHIISGSALGRIECRTELSAE